MSPHVMHWQRKKPVKYLPGLDTAGLKTNLANLFRGFEADADKTLQSSACERLCKPEVNQFL